MEIDEITIVTTNAPEKPHVNELLKWFGSSLGLFSLRDKNSSCFRVFIVLIKDARNDGEGLTSNEISNLTDLSRGTVVHHLNKLMSSGIVLNVENKYLLREKRLEELMEEVEKDLIQTMDVLKDVGSELDEMLGLEE